jgi:hypothetical protein
LFDLLERERLLPRRRKDAKSFIPNITVSKDFIKGLASLRLRGKDFSELSLRKFVPLPPQVRTVNL